MNRFAELLDRLAYEPGRNDKLRLIADYFRTHARSRARLGAGGAHRRAVVPARQARHDPRADRRAHRSGAVRAVLRLCRRPVGDRRADVAGRSGDSARTTTPSPHRRRRNAVHARQGATAGAARALARRARRDRPLGAAQARHRRPAHRRSARLAKTAAAALGDKDAGRSRAAVAGSDAALSRPVRLARRPRRQAGEPRPGAVPARRCWRTRSRRPISPRSIPPTSWRNGNGTASACRRSAGATSTASRSRGFIRAPARTSPRAFPISSRRCSCRRAIDGELLIMRERPRAVVQRAAAAAQPQDRHAEAARRNSRRICAPTTCSPKATRTCASCRSPSAARGWRTSSRGSTSRASTSRRWSPFATWDELAAARADPAAAGAGADADAVEGVMLKRRDAPYLPGPAEGTVVEMEARSVHRSTPC